MRSSLSLPLVASMILQGCNCGGGGGLVAAPDGGTLDLAKLTSLAVEPANLTLIADGETPAKLGYQAIGTFEGGRREDVTASATFRLSDPGLGDFQKNQFSSQLNRGGSAQVVAEVGAHTGQTGLMVVLRKRVTDAASTGLPPEVATRFGGPMDPARAPELVYPNDGVLVPPNLGKLEIHFLPKAGNTLFELSFSNALTDVKVYLRCTTPLNGGCIYLPAANVWSWLAATNRGGSPVEISLRGTDEEGSAVGTSSPLRLFFSEDDIEGGLYYWTTSQGTGIMRFDFASKLQTEAEKFIGTQHTGGTCVGCHALSRDGKKIVAEAGGQHDGRLLLLDVASRQPIVPFATPEKSIFESWNPEGSQYVGVYGDHGATNFNLMVFDGNNGSLVESIPGTGTSQRPADHPDWSPEGNRIVYTRVGIKNTLQMMYRGSIAMVARASGAWGAPVELVAAADGKNRYYPSFAPSGEFLVFNESTCPNGQQHVDCNADADPSAQMFVVEATPGHTPIELVRANAPGKTDGPMVNLANSFPKWSPFVFQRTGELSSRLLWVTFSSTRNYGLRNPPPGARSSLLWMSAIDPDKVGLGQDPSYPAFALPFQDLDTSNHIGQWATQVISEIN